MNTYSAAFEFVGLRSLAESDPELYADRINVINDLFGELRQRGESAGATIHFHFLIENALVQFVGRNIEEFLDLVAVFRSDAFLQADVLIKGVVSEVDIGLKKLCSSKPMTLNYSLPGQAGVLFAQQKKMKGLSVYLDASCPKSEKTLENWVRFKSGGKSSFSKVSELGLADYNYTPDGFEKALDLFHRARAVDLQEASFFSSYFSHLLLHDVEYEKTHAGLNVLDYTISGEFEKFRDVIGLFILPLILIRKIFNSEISVMKDNESHGKRLRFSFQAVDPLYRVDDSVLSASANYLLKSKFVQKVFFSTEYKGVSISEVVGEKASRNFGAAVAKKSQLEALNASST